MNYPAIFTDMTNMEATSRTKALCIASGKGGVGKTTFSINLSVALAEMGYRVLLFDGDLGLANAQIGFNCKFEHNIGHVLSGEVALEDILVETGYGVTLVPGASGQENLAAMDFVQSTRAVQLFSALQDRFDYLIVDCADGIAPSVMAFLKGSHYRLIIGTDELTSIADAYATIKVMVRDHRLSNIFFVPCCVGNDAEGELLFSNMNSVTRKFLYTELNYLGSVVRDDFVNTSWQKSVPLMKLAPSSVLASNYRRIASTLEGRMHQACDQGTVQFFN